MRFFDAIEKSYAKKLQKSIHEIPIYAKKIPVGRIDPAGLKG